MGLSFEPVYLGCQKVFYMSSAWHRKVFGAVTLLVPVSGRSTVIYTQKDHCFRGVTAYLKQTERTQARSLVQ